MIKLINIKLIKKLIQTYIRGYMFNEFIEKNSLKRIIHSQIRHQ